MTVRPMTQEDLSKALDWAASEGWNPGLDDAAAFYAADPEGYFVNEVEGEMAAVISVVNHSPTDAFLGLYICDPRFRGQGLGMEVWTAALNHAGDRTVGLDGVPDQQENYRKSGFTWAGKTTRYAGVMPVCSGTGRKSVEAGVLLQADATACGFERPRFSQTWFTDTESRKTVVLDTGSSEPSFLTIRTCRDGLKIGPLLAHSSSEVSLLLNACLPDFASKSVMIDVPDTSPELAELLTDMGFAPIFETARMYKGAPPKSAPPKFYGTATLELG